MKHLSVGWMGVFVLFVAALADSARADTNKFVFEREDNVWIANTDGTGAKKLAAGRQPDLSPDSTKVIYVTNQSDDKPVPPHLIMLDLASGKSSTLPAEGMVSDPLWSPDGGKVLMTVNSIHASIGIIDSDGNYFHLLRSPDFWGVNWAADGQSLFAQDMENLYRLDLNGKVLKKWVIATLIPKGEMSGSSRLTPSPDGKTLLMDVEMNEDARKGWEGPPPAIYTMDLATEKCTRLTPEKFYAWSCRWLKGSDSILYVSQKPNEDDSAIYSMSVTSHGKDARLLAKKASYPSAAR